MVPVSRRQDVETAQSYHKYGFLFLPWIWLVNWFYFKEVKDYPDTSPTIKQYAENSRNMFAIAMLVWFVWLITFYSFKPFFEQHFSFIFCLNIKQDEI